MRRIVIVAVLALSACRSSSPRSSAGGGGLSLPGAPSPRAAVEQFMTSVRMGDLQALSSVWGTPDGPARDNPKLSREELEKRSLIMQRCYQHDSFRILGETAGEGGARMLDVEISRGNLKRSPHFRTVVAKSERWFVEDADILAVKDLCGEQPR